MQAFLKKHGTGPACHSLKINWQRSGSRITIDFTVQKRVSTPWLSDSSFGQDWAKNWGLWNKDVVEAFLQLRAHEHDTGAPYLEIQVSPLNQPFALIIVEPRKTFHAPVTLDFQTQSSIEGRVWTGKLTVDLPSDLVGDKLYGGFFSCLAEGPREYYALEPNPEQNPDFHRPELFLPLDLE